MAVWSLNGRSKPVHCDLTAGLGRGRMREKVRKRRAGEYFIAGG